MDWKKSIKCIIFDLDGVIVDTAQYHFLAWKVIADDLGISFSEVENENLKGISRMDSLNFILGLGKIKLSEPEKSELAERKNSIYLELIDNLDESSILPGVNHWFDQCEEHRIKIALGSASKNARGILKAVNLVDRFSVIVDGNQTTRTKPDPQVFLLASEKLGILPQSCVVIEDSFKGIEAAIAGNFYSIGIGDSKILKNADINLSGLDESDINILQTLSAERNFRTI